MLRLRFGPLLLCLLAMLLPSGRATAERPVYRSPGEVVWHPDSDALYSSDYTADCVVRLAIGAEPIAIAIGGKLLGAGGGGYLLFLCEFNKWHVVAEKLAAIGGNIVNISFDFKGLQTWEVKES